MSTDLYMDLRPQGPSVLTALEREGLLRSDCSSVLLYGSSARGDQTARSDVDVLELVPTHPGSCRKAQFSITFYTPEQLATLVTGRSLFAWHLATEGLLLRDPKGSLRTILGRHPGPDADATLTRVHCFTSILDNAETRFDEIEKGLMRVTRFLLRTAVYASAFKAGVRTFSIRRAADSLDPSGELQVLLSLDVVQQSFGSETFLCMRRHLARLVGGLEDNPYGSIEALAVRSSAYNPALSSLAIRALINDPEEIEYAGQNFPVL